jgi:hypothetical protein
METLLRPAGTLSKMLPTLYVRLKLSRILRTLWVLWAMLAEGMIQLPLNYIIIELT